MRLYLIIGAVAALLTLEAWALVSTYRAGKLAGQTSIADRINQENDNAGSAAEKWRSDLRRCVDAGGLFDFEADTCDR